MQINCISFSKNCCGFQAAGPLGGTKEKTKIKEEIKGKKWTKSSQAKPSQANKWKLKQNEEGKKGERRVEDQ
jgi:hypothetical protein